MDKASLELISMFGAMLSDLSAAVLEKDRARFTEYKKNLSTVGDIIFEDYIHGEIDSRYAMIVMAVYASFDEMEKMCNEKGL